MCCFVVTWSEILYCQVTWGLREVCVYGSVCLVIFLPLCLSSLCFDVDVRVAHCPCFQNSRAIRLLFFLIFTFTAICNVCLDIKRVFLVNVHLFFSTYCVSQTPSSLKSITVLLLGLPNTVLLQFAIPQFLLSIWYWPEKHFMQNALNVLCFVFL